ncbi:MULTISPECIES: MoaD/ThiS family protein [unclassified Limnohabitans]|jgi:molybdopterin synthase sulfur carrier subunit|uniref:sulfur carrier protein ThiS n=1 Tax=unclassified Limnohabitans TaxID=2626134 RepID=UPI000CF2A211|nr:MULTISPECIES: MoaD/ThiS family protein [unclassified Limnohabitans]PQA82711.1 molybdopterin synthase sulfur carrier subunit [Limnohabitans sp. TS-CS-82]
MDITFKLFATLTDYLPPAARRSNVLNMEVDDGMTIAQIIEPFGMPEKLVHLVLVNGTFVPPEDRASKVLNDGDVLAVWPPVAGG